MTNRCPKCGASDKILVREITLSSDYTNADVLYQCVHCEHKWTTAVQTVDLRAIYTRTGDPTKSTEDSKTLLYLVCAVYHHHDTLTEGPQKWLVDFAGWCLEKAMSQQTATTPLEVVLEQIPAWLENHVERDERDDDDTVCVAYGVPPVETPESIGQRYPGKIKEANIAMMGNAYKDTPTVAALRIYLTPEQICGVLNTIDNLKVETKEDPNDA